MDTGHTESEVMMGETTGQSENSVPGAAEGNSGDSPEEVPASDSVEGTDSAQTDQNITQKEGSEDGPNEAGDSKVAEISEEVDPYFYLKRDEFTSEIFKIELSNLPQKFGFGVSLRKICM